jgi:hypothetical protein
MKRMTLPHEERVKKFRIKNGNLREHISMLAYSGAPGMKNNRSSDPGTNQGGKAVLPGPHRAPRKRIEQTRVARKRKIAAMP